MSSCGWRIANDLKGRTLREIINLGISIAYQCGQCGRTAVWAWPWMTRERRLRPLMSKVIHEFLNKLCCVNCRAKNSKSALTRHAIQRARLASA